MDSVRIAHLSDLHFGEKENEAVWDLLVEHLNKQLRPDLVLITGDIVNSPEPALFRIAKQQIDRLNAPYRVCPGNHDRFWRGNSAPAGFLARIFGGSDGASNIARPARGELENHFKGGLVLDPAIPYDIELPAGGTSPNSWKLRVLGCDSCEEDTYFAQGVLNAKTISALHQRAIAGNDRDLVIVLVHHHLLPIAALEGSLQPDLKALANVTGMLNAGTALNMLAKSYVNLVLHGHEHYPQAARFRTGNLAEGEVAVVAAGSATGTETLKGWSMKAARFNVLELNADRSVTLREVRGEGLFFAETEQPPIKLLDAEDIRRARFLRRTHPQRTPPRSRLTRVFEFGLDRDGLITDTRTDWLVGDKWVMPTQNRTGTPTTALLELHFPNAAPARRMADFVRTRAGDNSFEAVFDLQAEGRRKCDRVVTSWSWEAGAILTQDEIDTLRDPGDFRKDGKEYVGVAAPEIDLEELTLLVKLPEGYSPPPGNVEAWTSDATTMKWEKNEGLTRLVQEMGQGLFSLRIPYPWPKVRYAMCWPVAPRATPPAAVTQHLVARSATVFEGLRDAFARKLPADARIGLYVRDGSAKMLERLQGHGANPPTIEIDEASGIVRGAWWGRMRALIPEPAEPSPLFMAGDTYVVLTPLRLPGDGDSPTVGLLRVALASRIEGLETADEAQIYALQAFVASAVGMWYHFLT